MPTKVVYSTIDRTVKKFMWLLCVQRLKEEEDPFESLGAVYFSMPASYDYTLKGDRGDFPKP